MTEQNIDETSEQTQAQQENSMQVLQQIAQEIRSAIAQKKRSDIPVWLIVATAIPFIWIFFGTPFIIGVRMWNNSPIHPSFALFGAIAFASVIAFVIVLTLEFVTGDNLSFDFAGLKFTGTSGPVTLWILAFSAVMAAFVLAGFQDMAKSQASSQPGLYQLVFPASTPSPSPTPIPSSTPSGSTP